MAGRLLVLALGAGLLAGCTSRAVRPDTTSRSEEAAARPRSEVPGKAPDKAPRTYLGEGLASYYGPGLHGRPTASGERFNQEAMTAAHRTMKFGTCVRVVNMENGRSIDVRINDRGPFKEGRIIDVSLAAGRRLGMLEKGLARVRLYRCEDPVSAFSVPHSAVPG